MISDQEKLQDVIGTLKGLLLRLAPPPKVLVVEDDDNDWLLLERQLNKFVCQVKRCEDGNAAVSAIKTGEYDIILLDQRMPNLDGTEILQETVGFRERARVILVTGYPGAPQVSEALERGATLALPKPVGFEQLKLFLTPYAPP